MKSSLQRTEKQGKLKSGLRKEIEDRKEAITKIRTVLRAISRTHDEKIARDNL